MEERESEVHKQLSIFLEADVLAVRAEKTPGALETITGELAEAGVNIDYA